MSFVAITYSRLIGAEQTRIMMVSWGVAEGQTFVLEEPILIALTVTLPFILDRLTSNEVMAEFVNEVLSSTVGATVARVVGVVRSICGGG
mmetsp:Transcript_8670/g.21124  ORF Transcript_8670/g.21124 Transcript_8670/m.21124 type:complete len:90 (+) Transcript_8670:3-272(+)